MLIGTFDTPGAALIMYILCFIGRYMWSKDVFFREAVMSSVISLHLILDLLITFLGALAYQC